MVTKTWDIQMFAVVSDKNEVVAVAATKDLASTVLSDGQSVVRADTVCSLCMLREIRSGAYGLCDWIYWHQ
jgi:hypothetical protein